MTLRIPGRVAFLVPWPRPLADRHDGQAVSRGRGPAVGRRGGGRRDPRDGERGDGHRPVARRRRGHVRRAAPAGRAVGRHLDRQGLARAPGQRRGRAASSGSPAASTRPTGSWPATPSTPSLGADEARRRPSATAELPILGARRPSRPGRARGRGSPPAPASTAMRHGPRWTATAREADALIAVGGAGERPRPLVDGFPYLEAEVGWAVEHELALSLDDVLARRIRLAQELPDRGASIAPRVAAIMAPLLGWDDARCAARGRDLPRGRPPRVRRAVMTDRPVILALDQGTTSSRAIAFDAAGTPVASAQQEFAQGFPSPGHVTHDPEEIWSSQLAGRAGRSSRRSGAPATSRRSGSPTSARPRSSGSGPPAAPSPPRSSGRAGSPRRSATGCAPRATSRSSASGPGCRSTPTSPARRSAHILEAGGLAIARRARRARLRHGRRVARSGG